MERLGVATLAERSGVSEQEIDTLSDLGILPSEGGETPFTDADVKRVKLAMACRQLAVPLDVVLSAQEALGFSRPGPDDACREDDADIMAVFAASAAQVPPGALLAVLRVWSESLLRMTRAEIQAYQEYYQSPLLQAGVPQDRMLDIAPQVSPNIVPLKERAVLSVYRRQQEHTWTEDIVEHIEAALEDAGVHQRLDRPPAMCFLDLTGYTRLTEERGPPGPGRARRRVVDLEPMTTGIPQVLDLRRPRRPRLPLHWTLAT